MHPRLFISFGKATPYFHTNGWQNINVNINNGPDLVVRVRAHLCAHRGFAIATLNLHHLHGLQRDNKFYAAYKRHDIITADGVPVALIGKAMGKVVRRVAGADIIRPLMKLAAEVDCPVAVIGGTEKSLNRAIEVLTRENPGVRVVFRESPPMGFDPLSREAAGVLQRLAQSGARLCFVALGAPKQEILAAMGRDLMPNVGFACIGAGIDFISGAETRAPQVLQTIGLEWLWRLAHAPRRLVGRYARCILVLPSVAVNSALMDYRLSKRTMPNFPRGIR